MKKQIIALLTAASLLLPSAAALAAPPEVPEESAAEQVLTEAADEGEVELFEEIGITIPVTGVSGSCGDNLTWSLSTHGILVISGSGDMWDWTFSSSSSIPWYSYKSSIKTVIIEDGITSIGDVAFIDCYYLTSVTISDSVTYIGDLAFADCENLASITIPDSVTWIDGRTFRGCSSLTSITIPSGVRYIGSETFRFCYNLTVINVAGDNQYYKSVNGILFTKDGTELHTYPCGKTDSSYSIPAEITSIEWYAFDGCDSLTSIEMPENLIKIGGYAFSGCNGLTNMIIPEGVTKINTGAFSSCNGLTSMIIPNGIDNIAVQIFYNCYSLTSVTIPSNVTSIGDAAFLNCYSLTSVTIPNSVTNIGNSAFYYCLALTDIYYSGTEDEWNAIEIGEKNECLTNATIHYNSVTAEPTSAPVVTETPAPSSVPTPTPTPTPIPHSGTDGAVTWSVENGTLTITGTGAIPDYSAGGAPWYAIKGEISKIVIEQGIDTIGTNAFYDLSRVSEAALPSTVTQVNAGAFEGCTALGSIALPEGMNRGIGAGAFKNTGLTTITVPSGVTAIEQGAFEGCISITEITLPFIGSQVGSKNNTDTFDYIFGGAVPASLRKVTITNETVVPANAFKDLANIENITINNGVTEIGNGAFDGCSALKSFVIPSGITEIGDNTFRGCENAVTITVPDTVKAIGEAAFDGCKKLKEINIPSGVTLIRDYTFLNCESLTKIEIPSAVMNIGVSVLEGCKKLYSIKIPFVGSNDDPDATDDENDGIFGYFFGCENHNIPASVTKVEITGTSANGYIPEKAFKDCAYIEDIIIDGGRAVLDNAFENCKNLKNLYIPKSISNIGDTILKDCTSLETLVVPFIGISRLDQNKETSVLGGFFGYNDQNKKGVMQYYDGINYHYYNIPSTLKKVSVLNHTVIPYGAFMQCYMVEQVAIISGAAMNEKAFYNCTSLKSITLPNDLQTIGAMAFAECESLETINIPTKVKTIGEQSFYNCRSLKNVLMPDSITEIADDIFNGTNLFSEVNLLANIGVITCSEGSVAYNYAVEKGIKTNVVSSEKLDVKKTATTVALLSDNSYMFNVTDSYNMHGVLHVELYNDSGELITEQTREADDVEYRVEFTAAEMTGVSYVKVYIAEASGETVTTEDETISYSDGGIPEIPENNAQIEYAGGTVTFTGTLISECVLLQAIYNGDNTLNRVNTYPVSDINDEIEADNSFEKGTAKFMLWESLEGMKPVSDTVIK